MVFFAWFLSVQFLLTKLAVTWTWDYTSIFLIQLFLQNSPQKQWFILIYFWFKNLFWLNISLNYQIRCCNSNSCKFSYLKSFIPFRKHFSTLESHKNIRDSGLYLYQQNCWTNLVSVIYFSFSIFHFPVILLSFLRSTASAFHFYLHYSKN